MAQILIVYFIVTGVFFLPFTKWQDLWVFVTIPSLLVFILAIIGPSDSKEAEV